MPHLLILNGPNLNLLGSREPKVYGGETLQTLEDRCLRKGQELNVQITCRQSNYEGELIEFIHAARENVDGIIINPAGYSHSSIAILDALHAYDGPVIEVHISNTHRRESFRHHSFVSQRADAVAMGFGLSGYEMAIAYLALQLSSD